MKTIFPPILLLAALLPVIAWTQQIPSAADIQSLASAEARMFQNVNYTHANAYFATDVADDFFTINADGVTADKASSLADTLRLKMFEMGQLKTMDHQYRIYGNVGITNGRGQVFVNDTMVVEFLYTTVFVKRNGKWMYTGWQGTLSKDSPKMPPMPQ